jgi:transcriptional regulator with XRE-family HTH domain
MSKSELLQALLSKDFSTIVDDYFEFSKTIKELMAMAKVTQQQLADLLSIDQSKVSRRLTNPELWTEEEIRKVAALLKEKLS